MTKVFIGLKATHFQNRSRTGLGVINEAPGCCILIAYSAIALAHLLRNQRLSSILRPESFFSV